jgi:hypothetical protein
VWRCVNCDQQLDLPAAVDPALPTCLVCHNSELYRKKDFPHTLGMAILVVACAVTFVTYGYYQWWLTWGILIGTALFDGLLYWWVGDVVVCYRCNAHHRGLPPTTGHPPFELGVAERYRQERIRREQLRAGRIRNQETGPASGP